MATAAKTVNGNSFNLPESINSKDAEELLGYFEMDLKWTDHKDYHKSHIVDRLFDKTPVFDFDYEGVSGGWNNVFGKFLDLKALSFRHILTKEEETLLFHQFNYSRMRVFRVRKIAKSRKLSQIEIDRGLFWGRLMSKRRDILIVYNLGLILTMGKQRHFTTKIVDSDDLISEGYQAVMKAIDRFDIGRGFKFSTYCCRSILQRMSRGISYAAKKQAEILCDFSENPPEKIDCSEVTAESSDYLDYMQRMFESDEAGLTDIERDILRYRYLNKDTLTLEEIGKLVGVTKERIRQVQNKALRKMKEAMEEEITLK